VPAAGELHLGEVGGNTKPVIVYPTITAGAYGANDIIGGNLSIATAGRVSGKSGILQTITVIDKGKKNAQLDFLFFTLLAGTYHDNDPEAITTADALNCIGGKTVYATDYLLLANYSLATVSFGLPYTPTMTALAFLVRASSAVTYLTANDLQFVFGLLRD
jgi:hypothetical protein